MTPFTRGYIAGAASIAALVISFGLAWVNGAVTYEAPKPEAPKQSTHYMTAWGPRQW